ncbi:class I SAM-dependent methyltransferase [Acidobacteriota bacterium]
MIQIKKWKIGLFFGLLALAFLSLEAFQEKGLDVPYVPTPVKVVEAMLAMAEVSKDDILYDLGCGDGRIVISAARDYGTQGVGIDLDPQRIKECHENAITAGVEDHVQFFQTDLFEADFSEASVVALYLLTENNLRLRPKFLKELIPGSRIVSHDYDMGRWKADKEILIEEDWEIHAVYFWIVPANVSGTWTWSMPTESGNKTFTLNLEQYFQHVSGEAFENNLLRPISITERKIIGNTFAFIMERKQEKSSEWLIFEGRVDGHSMVGTVKTKGSKNSKKWKAKRKPGTQVSIYSPEQDPLFFSR